MPRYLRGFRDSPFSSFFKARVAAHIQVAYLELTVASLKSDSLGQQWMIFPSPSSVEAVGEVSSYSNHLPKEIFSPLLTLSCPSSLIHTKGWWLLLLPRQVFWALSVAQPSHSLCFHVISSVTEHSDCVSGVILRTGIKSSDRQIHCSPSAFILAG